MIPHPYTASRKAPRTFGRGAFTAVLTVATATLFAAAPAQADFLVGNTSGNSVSQFDSNTGAFLGSFITAGSGGLASPDDLTYGPDGNLYVSSSSSSTTGQILRFDGRTGAFIGVFAQGGGMARPYGVAFGPDGKLYVASFRSDQILRYDGATGAFIDVFAAGNGTAAGLLNGPNDLHFGADGRLYVTTQGSVANGQGGISYLFDSQVLRYDIATGSGSVLATPVPTATGAGYVSMLGIATGPDGRLYTSDYAGGIRSYDPATGALLQTIETGALFGSGTPTTFGNFAFGSDGALYASVFNGNGLAQAGIARCTVGSDAACALFADGSGVLARPIGLTLLSPVPEPGAALLLASGLAVLAWRRRAAARVAREPAHASA